MGNTRSSYFDQKPDDVYWSNSAASNEPTEQEHRNISDDLADINEKNYSEERLRNFDEFEQEFARKREKRKEILAQKKKEMEDLREEVQRLREENEVLRRVQSQSNSSSDGDSSDNLYKIVRLEQENETLKMLVQEKGRLLIESEKIIDKNRELRVEIVQMQQELQRLNNEMLNFEKERKDYKAHVVALKDVIAVSKNMLQIRETELNELKAKMVEIEKSLADKEIQLLSKNLRSEYERQMANIRDLRALYEERQRAASREKEELTSQLNDAKKELEDEQNKNRELQERIADLENDNSKKYDEIKQLESNMGIVKAESRQYQAELTVINQLFSEILLGFNSTQVIDLDKLQKHLEEHHGLLQDIVVNEVASSSYALPKVLLDLLNQVEATKKEKKDIDQTVEEVENRNLETIEEETESATSTLHNQMNSAEEIVENLPKVWRVLIELLSHHVVPVNTLSDDDESDNPCYKTVDTPKGPSVVLSVSQTFIRLKDLILEKKALEKETNHLKELNGHLENRLQDQEKRLELVHSELSKTWLMVGKLQKQHQLLHTQEKILRYELAQKRKLLTQLKEELEYSREKWAQAREKNSNTEEQWRQLRNEFAARKTTLNDDANNSAESGYSDDKECSSSDDEPSYDTDEVDEVPKKEKKGVDLSASTNTLTDLTVNADESQNLEQNSTNILKENASIVSTKLSQEALTGLGGSSQVQPSESGEQAVTPQCSNKTAEENVVEKTWERVSDIVQQEILRLTDRSTQKTDFDPDRFLLQERLGTSEQAKDKTDLHDVPSTSTESQIDTKDVPSTSTGSNRTLEEVLAARNERFKRLEEQAQQLRKKVVNTNKRSNEISNRLDSLHETYGQSVDSNQEEDVRLEDGLVEPENINVERTEGLEEDGQEES